MCAFETNIQVITVTICTIRTACLYQGSFSNHVRQMYTTSNINSRILLQMINLFGSLVTQQLEMTGTSCVRHAKYAKEPVRKITAESEHRSTVQNQ